MSLLSALNSATSGLRTAQLGLDLVSRNVANATTPGYTRKTLPQEARIVDGESQGVKTLEVQRNVNALLQRQFRQGAADTEALSVTDDFLARLEQAFGRPEDANSIASVVGGLNDAFKTLATTPESLTAQRGAIGRAEDLARNLNGLSNTIQSLRTEAERSIGDAVNTIRDKLQAIDEINSDISRRTAVGDSTADLQDQRDMLINDLSKLIDISYFTRDTGDVVIYTTNGRPLLDGDPADLSYTPSGILSATSVYPLSISGIMLDGYDITGQIQSGRLAGLIDLRDTLLPQAQDQLDELASQLSQGFSALGLELFTDGPASFVPANTLGYAGRITVNSVVRTEPWRMRDGTLAPVPSTLESDATIPLAVLNMFESQQTFSAGPGLGTSETLQGYAASFVSFQSSQRAQYGDRLFNQKLLSDSLEHRLSNDSGVNIDQEMALMIQLQNSYGASARVIQTVRDMLDTLLQIV